MYVHMFVFECIIVNAHDKDIKYMFQCAWSSACAAAALHSP